MRRGVAESRQELDDTLLERLVVAVFYHDVVEGSDYRGMEAFGDSKRHKCRRWKKTYVIAMISVWKQTHLAPPLLSPNVLSSNRDITPFEDAALGNIRPLSHRLEDD